jgi:hypothetical protein
MPSRGLIGTHLREARAAAVSLLNEKVAVHISPIPDSILGFLFEGVKVICCQG